MNLASHLPIDADDYGQHTAPDTVRVERLLPGPIDRVWDHLVQPELRATWIAGGTIEPRVGGRVELVFRHATLTRDDDPPPPKYAAMRDEARMQGTVTAWEPPHRLAYTWGEDGGGASHVLFELAEEAGRVRLVVTHTRLGERGMLLSVSAGWHAHLDILRDRLEGREPSGFWRRHTALEAEYAQRLPE
jgi:uncharacterized protein YndB with AHSA1/START domain